MCLINVLLLSEKETVFYDHKRTVNRIQFHPYEKDVLLSGSQDGTMKYFVRHSICVSFVLCYK